MPDTGNIWVECRWLWHANLISLHERLGHFRREGKFCCSRGSTISWLAMATPKLFYYKDEFSQKDILACLLARGEYFVTKKGHAWVKGFNISWGSGYKDGFFFFFFPFTKRFYDGFLISWVCYSIFSTFLIFKGGEGWNWMDLIVFYFLVFVERGWE